MVRLWQVIDAKGGTSKALAPLGGVPVRGFVNSLQVARSGRFLVAGVGQELPKKVLESLVKCGRERKWMRRGSFDASVHPHRRWLPWRRSCCC